MANLLHRSLCLQLSLYPHGLDSGQQLLSVFRGRSDLHKQLLLLFGGCVVQVGEEFLQLGLFFLRCFNCRLLLLLLLTGDRGGEEVGREGKKRKKKGKGIGREKVKGGEISSWNLITR